MWWSELSFNPEADILSQETNFSPDDSVDYFPITSRQVGYQKLTCQIVLTVAFDKQEDKMQWRWQKRFGYTQYEHRSINNYTALTSASWQCTSKIVPNTPPQSRLNLTSYHFNRLWNVTHYEVEWWRLHYLTALPPPKLPLCKPRTHMGKSRYAYNLCVRWRWTVGFKPPPLYLRRHRVVPIQEYAGWTPGLPLSQSGPLAEEINLMHLPRRPVRSLVTTHTELLPAPLTDNQSPQYALYKRFCGLRTVGQSW